jgi:hypothetical protein
MARLAELCVRENIGRHHLLLARRRFLTGKYRGEADFAKSPRGAGMQKFMNPRGLRILAALDAVSNRCGATMAQVALAWLMQRPGVTAPYRQRDVGCAARGADGRHPLEPRCGSRCDAGRGKRLTGCCGH